MIYSLYPSYNSLHQLTCKRYLEYIVYGVCTSQPLTGF